MTNILGLAYRARKIVTGTSITLKELRRGKLFLIIMATDASSNTKKQIYDKAKYYNTAVVELFNSSEQSKAMGKENIMVIGVLDKGFSQLLRNQEGSGNNGESTTKEQKNCESATKEQRDGES